MGYRQAYQGDGHTDFEISGIVWEDDHISQITGQEPGDEPTREDESQSNLFNTPLEYMAEESYQQSLQEYEDALEAYEELYISIPFEYESPAISVDTSGRFSKHQIIGGATVRQKIGEDPIQVSISGICREPTARRLDNLRNAKYGRIVSTRLPGGSLDVQFASTGTSPMDNAGAVAISDDDGEFLYEFQISAIEVIA